MFIKETAKVAETFINWRFDRMEFVALLIDGKTLQRNRFSWRWDSPMREKMRFSCSLKPKPKPIPVWSRYLKIFWNAAFKLQTLCWYC